MATLAQQANTDLSGVVLAANDFGRSVSVDRASAASDGMFGFTGGSWATIITGMRCIIEKPDIRRVERDEMASASGFYQLLTSTALTPTTGVVLDIVENFTQATSNLKAPMRVVDSDSGTTLYYEIQSATLVPDGSGLVIADLVQRELSWFND